MKRHPAALVSFLFVLVGALAAPASAQETDYGNPQPPAVQPQPPEEPSVPPAAPPEEPTEAPQGPTEEPPPVVVIGETVTPQPQVASQQATRGLPLTGGDITGMIVFGVAAAGAGALFVRAGRRKAGEV